MLAPQPTAAWPLRGDDSLASLHGGAPMSLHGSQCLHNQSTDGLLLGPVCFATTPHSPSLVLGAASFSACLRFRTDAAGIPLLSKFGPPAAAALNYHLRRGIAVAIADGGRGIGVSFADSVGVSAFEELNGRGVLVDGRWHHTCVVLQRATHAPSLTLYIDGHSTERRSLRATRLLRMGSLDTCAPLVLGRGPGADLDGDVDASVGGRRWHASIGEVAIWTRALLPEHVASLAMRGLPPIQTSHWRRGRGALSAANAERRAGPATGGPAFSVEGGATSSRHSSSTTSTGTGTGTLPSGTLAPLQSGARNPRWMREPRWAAAPLLLLATWALAGNTLRRHRLQAMGAGLGRWMARSMC